MRLPRFLQYVGVFLNKYFLKPHVCEKPVQPAPRVSEITHGMIIGSLAKGKLAEDLEIVQRIDSMTGRRPTLTPKQMESYSFIQSASSVGRAVKTTLSEETVCGCGLPDAMRIDDKAALKKARSYIQGPIPPRHSD